MNDIKVLLGRNFNNQGELFHFQGNYAQAGNYYKDALSHFTAAHQSHQDSTLSIDDCDSCRLDIAALYHNQAKLSDDMGIYDETERLYLKAAEMRQKIWKTKPDISIAVHTIRTYNNLAAFYHHRWLEFTKAAIYYERALDICSKKLGADSPEASQIRTYQAQLRLDETMNQSLDDATQARQYYIDVQMKYKGMVAIYQNVHSVSHAYSQQTIWLNNLAVNYHLNNKLDDARERYEQALQVYTDQEWEDHFSYAVIATNFAHLLQKQSEQAIASMYFKKAEKIYQDRNGAYYSFYQVANFLTDYAYFFLAAGNYDKTIKLLIQAIDIYRCQQPFLGHDRLIMALEAYQEYYKRGSRAYDEPIQVYKQLLMEYEKSCSAANPQIANIRRSYALCLERNGEPSQATQQYKSALDAYNQALCSYVPGLELRDNWARQGANPPQKLLKDGRGVRVLREIELTLVEYTRLLVSFGSSESKQTLNIYQKALRTYEDTLGTNHWLFADICGGYSRHLDELGYKDDAKKMADKARTIRRRYSKSTYLLLSNSLTLTLLW